MATKSTTKNDRLAAIREKLKKTDTGGGGRGFFSAKEGRNVIRILPEVGEMQFFFQEVGTHNFPDGRKIYCPNFTTVGEKDCPVCELISQLYQDGSPASRKLAKAIGLRRNYWMNVINRDAEDLGPLIFTPGVKIFGQIQGIVGDPDYGDVTDPNDGFDVVVNRTGKSLNTEYDVKARRNPSPISDDVDLAEKWLAAAKDLSWIEVGMDEEDDKELSEGHALYIQPYKRLVHEFGLNDLDVEELASQVKDDTEEAAETPKQGKAAKAQSVKGKVVVKDVEEEDDEDVDDEDEEEEPAKQEVARRAARRSTRR